jgi:hypothetical protein
MKVLLVHHPPSATGLILKPHRDSLSNDSRPRNTHSIRYRMTGPSTVPLIVGLPRLTILLPATLIWSIAKVALQYPLPLTRNEEISKSVDPFTSLRKYCLRYVVDLLGAS